MRLTSSEIRTVQDVITRRLGSGAEAFLFGSRLDNAAMGGDVDILIEADRRLSLIERAEIKMELEQLLDLPVDVVSHARNTIPTPFQALIRAKAVKFGNAVMTTSTLDAERAYLAGLLEAVQRCVYFLNASDRKLNWPLSADYLERHKKNVELFESLATVNERFAKIQDTLGAAMRHAVILAGENGETFLRVLTFYEKVGVLESIASWQICRTSRNLAAHEYEIDYSAIAEHFNALHTLVPGLYAIAARFFYYCRDNLGMLPANGDFLDDFLKIVGEQR